MSADEPLTLDRIRQMKPTEINADWDRVSRVLSGKPAERVPLRTLDDLRGLEPAEVNDRWAEVQDVLAGKEPTE